MKDPFERHWSVLRNKVPNSPIVLLQYHYESLTLTVGNGLTLY
jgi:hypothetical protein